MPRRLLLTLLALLLAVGTATAVVLQQRAAAADRAAREAATAFARAASAGQLPDEVDATTSSLGVDPQVRVVVVERDGDRATAELGWRWPYGPDGWAYTTRLALARTGERWEARPTADAVHPELQTGDVLASSREPAARGPVLGRDGSPLVTETPVVEIGVQPSRATDPAALARTLAGLLDVDGAALEQRIRAASPDAFVDVLVLRRSDYEPLRAQLQPLPGTVFRESSRPLAPTRAFARALLGTAGPVTAELVEASDGRLAPGDVAGLSGLQRAYDSVLGGTAGTVVERVSGEQRTPVFSVPAQPGRPVQVTLDRAVQGAADAALAAVLGSASLVAIDVASGDVLAVANTPVGGADRATTGRYPPGSTFKAVSALALVGDGVTPATGTTCPATATVDGRSFRNFEGGALGDVPFGTAFAQSCNTAFVQLSGRLAGALPEAARRLGLGVPWGVGVDLFAGEVPEPQGPVELAAAAIGQGRTLVSPAAMAQVAATVARGSWSPPRLVVDPQPGPSGAQPPSPDPAAATVRELMREVVVRGTAAALADVPGEPVHAKTGTAEYGTESPPRTHAWTVGFQGGLAFAVLVEDGASGGAVAVPVVEAFLRGL